MRKVRIYIIILISLVLPINIYAYSNKLIPGGETIGININTNGVMVIGFYKIDGKLNKGTPNIKVGDIITRVGDKEVNTTDELINEINSNMTDNKVELTILSGKKYKYVTLNLYYSEGAYKTGLYVKDSISGIGTLSYIDPEESTYGALGHAIIETNSGKKLEVKDGNIFKSYITGIDRSTSGSPGGKNAKFYSNVIFGDINKNDKFGIFGNYKEDTSNKEVLNIKDADEIKPGKAYIYTVIDGDKKEKFEIEIKNIRNDNSNKDISFEVTDKRLLEKTGGIVQGMSGSPIIEDNYLIGAVTYVDVSNPKIGYGVSIKKMLEASEK